MATDEKINIWVRIADVKPLELSINPADEPLYREAEQRVNKLWNKWMTSFGSSRSPQEVMAMVAFQFARLFAQTYNDNVGVNKLLTDFEQRLDEIVMRM